tara:strand:- start:254 stop:523 length:270 start_codon:yes stop_codon:yes gene_type:complete
MNANDEGEPRYFGIDVAIMSDGDKKLIISIYDEEVEFLAKVLKEIPTEVGLGMVEEFVVEEEFIDRLPAIPWWASTILSDLLKVYAAAD